MLRQGRYKSLVIEGDFGLLSVVDYIHLNPVRAKLLTVDQLRDYRNSSFPKYFIKNRHPCLRSEDFLKEAGGLKPTLSGIRQYHKRLQGIMEESPQKRKAMFEDLSQGWYIGSKEGKQLFSEKVKQGKVQASADAQLELAKVDCQQLIKTGSMTLSKNKDDVANSKKSAQWKLAMASWIKERTPIKNKDLSDQLAMGHPATMSNHITAYRKTQRKRCRYYKKLCSIL